MNTYSEKLITVEFKLYNQKEPVRLSDYRCALSMSNAGGRSQSQIDLSIFNVNQDLTQMIVGQGFSTPRITNAVVSVLAGAANEQTQIYQGTIYDAFVDYNQMPDVPLRIKSTSTYFYRVKPVAPNSYINGVDVAEVIKGLAKACNYTFVNHGVSVILKDMYLCGSAIEQIMDCVDAADIGCTIHNGVVEISRKGDFLSDVVTEISPETGLIGYPTVTNSGVLVNMVFSPKLRRLNRVNIKSGNKAANGLFTIRTMEHNISTKTPGGSWLTSMLVFPVGEQRS